MSVRHPLYSIGEGVFSEKEERLRKQGLLPKKKSTTSEQPMSANQNMIVQTDTMWTPTNLPTNNIVSKPKEPQSIMDKIWGKKKL